MVDEAIQKAVEEEAESIPLDQAIAVLQQAKRAKNAGEAFESVRDALGKLSGDDLSLLLDNEEFQKLIYEMTKKVDQSRKPGSPVFDARGRQIGKVPYTMKYLEETNPIVEWIPTRTTHIGYNGVTIFVTAHNPVKSPAVFRDIFMQSERDTAEAYGQMAAVLQRSGAADGVSPSVGWLKLSDEELEKRFGREV